MSIITLISLQSQTLMLYVIMVTFNNNIFHETSPTEHWGTVTFFVFEVPYINYTDESENNVYNVRNLCKMVNVHSSQCFLMTLTENMFVLLVCFLFCGCTVHEWSVPKKTNIKVLCERLTEQAALWKFPSLDGSKFEDLANK